MTRDRWRVPVPPHLHGKAPRKHWNANALAFLGDSVWEVREGGGGMAWPCPQGRWFMLPWHFSHACGAPCQQGTSKRTERRRRAAVRGAWYGLLVLLLLVMPSAALPCPASGPQPLLPTLLQLYVRRRFFYPPSARDSYFSQVVRHVRAETQVRPVGAPAVASSISAGESAAPAPAIPNATT